MNFKYISKILMLILFFTYTKAVFAVTDDQIESVINRRNTELLSSLYEVEPFDVNLILPLQKLSLLKYAVQIGNVSMVKFLIDKKADVNLKDEDGSTPLMSAALNNDLETVSILIAAGADVLIKDGFNKDTVDYSIHSNGTLFYFLISKIFNNLNSVQGISKIKTHLTDVFYSQNTELILKLVFTNEILTNFNKMIILDKLRLLCAVNNDFILLKYLINETEKYPELKKLLGRMYFNSAGNTLLHVAVLNESFDVVNLLINEGYSIYLPNYKSQSSLSLSLSLDNDKMYKYLTSGVTLFSSTNAPVEYSTASNYCESKKMKCINNILPSSQIENNTKSIPLYFLYSRLLSNRKLLGSNTQSNGVFWKRSFECKDSSSNVNSYCNFFDDPVSEFWTRESCDAPLDRPNLEGYIRKIACTNAAPEFEFIVDGGTEEATRHGDVYQFCKNKGLGCKSVTTLDGVTVSCLDEDVSEGAKFSDLIFDYAVKIVVCVK